MSVVLKFYGAAGCVTGSCTAVETEGGTVLIDCGLFQGPKTLKALNYAQFPFNPENIQAVLLTHAHIDHSGLLPKLVGSGFSGPIYATPGTIDLCRVMLPDAGGIQEAEVISLNRRLRHHGEQEVEPIYTAAQAEAMLGQFEPIAFHDWKQIMPGLKARYWSAGHILGSASIELEISDGTDPMRLLFSGDLGPGGSDFVEDSEGPINLNHIILEGTYGATIRPDSNGAKRRAVLAEELRFAASAGGPLLIPAFAVERTQELITDLLDLMDKNEVPHGPIFLDSPLAIRATEAFLAHGQNDDGKNPFARLAQSPHLHCTEGVSESRGIERFSGWHIIVAASGMCDAGRVRHHLKRLLPRPEATVLLTGFQPVGTLGRLLIEGRQRVRIQGDDIRVRAAIRSIDVYSGHADANGLANWLKARGTISGSVFLNHGEPENLTALRNRLKPLLPQAKAPIIAALDQVYQLTADTQHMVRVDAPPRLAPDAPTKLDWHNLRADFLTRLNDALEQAPDDAARETLLNTLRQNINP